MKITLEQLKELRACYAQVKLFEELFSLGVNVTPEVIQEHGGEFDVNWFAQKTLAGQTWAEYKHVRNQERTEYQRVRGLAWAEHSNVKGLAQAEYNRVHDQAWAEYRKTCWAVLLGLSEKESRC